MRLALLWVAATTISLAGCFSPKINPGDQCTASGDCPGNLTCVEGFCCEGQTACGVIDDDGGPPDAAPDAEPQAFTEHEDEFECDGNTIVRLSFDSEASMEFTSCNNDLTQTVEMPFTEPAMFNDGVRLNTGPSATQFVEFSVPSAQPPELTIEAWIKPITFSAGSNTVVASVRSETINSGSWILSVTDEGAVQLDVFGAANSCANVIATISTDPQQIPLNQLTHVRATLAGQAKIFVNGYQRASEVVGGTRCQTTDANFRVGGLVGARAGFNVFVGVMDEVRYSDVVR